MDFTNGLEHAYEHVSKSIEIKTNIIAKSRSSGAQPDVCPVTVTVANLPCGGVASSILHSGECFERGQAA